MPVSLLSRHLPCRRGTIVFPYRRSKVPAGDSRQFAEWRSLQMRTVLLVMGILLLAASIPLASCTSSGEDVSDVSPHDIQARIDDSGDDNAKRIKAWQEYRDRRVRWIGELVRVVSLPGAASGSYPVDAAFVALDLPVAVTADLLNAPEESGGKVVGVFGPGGWGLHHPRNLNTDIGPDQAKPDLRPGGDGVFSPGGWGVVAVVFDGDEAAKISGAASGLPTGKRQFRLGDPIIFEGTLASTNAASGCGVDPEHGVPPQLKAELDKAHFGLISGSIVGRAESFFDI